MCYHIFKPCSAKLTSCSNQAAPTDQRETADPSPSTKDQQQQWPNNDRADDVALRDPHEPAPDGDTGPEDFIPTRKRLKSPTASVNANRTRAPSPARRSKGRHHTTAELVATAQKHRFGADVRSSPNMSYKARARTFLPLEINCKPAHALLDSGVIGNAICEDYAHAIGAVIERPSVKQNFVNAKNTPFESMGTTKLTFSIPADRFETSRKSEWTYSFAVFQHLAAPLVLGNQFLRETGGLARFAELMVRKTLSVVSDKIDKLRKVWMFMHMDLPTQKLGCFLDAEPTFAALDSGSDIDAVSLSYAKFREWKVEPLPEDEGYVLLANNELVKLAGYVDTTLGIRGGCIPRRLYVLDGLFCDAVVGDATIETLDIFNEFQSSLVDTAPVEAMDLFCNIQCVDKVRQIEHKVDELLAERPGAASSKIENSWWASFLPKRASRKDESTDEGKQTLNRVNLRFSAHSQRQRLWKNSRRGLRLSTFAQRTAGGLTRFSS